MKYRAIRDSYAKDRRYRKGEVYDFNQNPGKHFKRADGQPEVEEPLFAPTALADAIPTPQRAKASPKKNAEAKDDFME